MHAVAPGIYKIQDVRKITEEGGWTRIWRREGLEQNMGGNQIPWKSHLDRSNVCSHEKCQQYFFIEVWCMQFYISLLEEQNLIFLKIVEVIRRDPPAVEGERRSIFYSPRALPRVHGVLTRPGWFSHRDQQTWITQGLFAKGKDQDLAVQLVYLLKHNRFPVSRKWKIGWGELSMPPPLMQPPK